MSLQRLRAALSTADYKPHTMATGSDYGSLAQLASPEAAAFLNAWSQEARGPALVSADAWSGPLRRRYWSLEDDERTEVLALVSFTLHELMHKIDFLTTPFGVGFHGRTCLETIGLLVDGAELIDETQRTRPHGPLRDVPRSGDGYTASGGIEALGARVRWFDALRGAASAHIAPGWGSDSDDTAWQFAAGRYELVLVHEIMPTLALPGGDGTYLRPLTILECRAVAVTGLNLLSRLGDGPGAATEVARFLQALYSPAAAYLDYWFLLDMYAHLAGHDDFVSSVAAGGGDWLRQALLTMVCIGWYALHATPEADPDAMANGSPVMRLMLALEELLEHAQARRRWPDALALFDAIDAGERARGLQLTSSRETLAYSILYLRSVRSYNARINPHAELAAHFEQVMSIQQLQLEQRLEHGYRSFLGLPDGGDLLRLTGDGGKLRVRLSRAEQRLLSEEVEASASVRRWFGLRETLLFRHARPPGFWEELWSTIGGFGSATADPPSPQEAAGAREDALTRTRFATGGHWVREGGALPAPDGIVDQPFVGVDPRLLPVAFGHAAAGRTDEVLTHWEVLVGDDTWIALQIELLAAGEQVRLLFSLLRHRELLEQITSAGRVLLASFEAVPWLRAGKPHAQVVAVPVTANASTVVAMLHAPTVARRQDERGWTVELVRQDEVLWSRRVEARAWTTADATAAAAEALAQRMPPTVTLWRVPVGGDAEQQAVVACGPAEAIAQLWSAGLDDAGRPVPLAEGAARQCVGQQLKQVLDASATHAPRPASP